MGTIENSAKLMGSHSTCELSAKGLADRLVLIVKELRLGALPAPESSSHPSGPPGEQRERTVVVEIAA
jgi:hypothetical protein